MFYKYKIWLVFTLTISFFVLQNSSAIAAAITFNTALPVSQGQRIARGLVTINRRSGSIEENNTSIEQINLASLVGYGVNAKWAVFGVLPSRFVKRDVENQTQTDSAIGRAEIFSRYEIARIDKQGSTYRIAPFAGVRLATGDTDIRSDTTDVFGGVIFTSANIHQSFEAQIRYDRNGSNNLANIGDSLSTDLAWHKRVFPSKITSNTSGFWYTVLEANITYAAQDNFSGRRDTNSGRFIASLSPGIQYATRRWIGELAVQIPIIKNLNGETLEPDYTVFSGIRVNF